MSTVQQHQTSTTTLNLTVGAGGCLTSPAPATVTISSPNSVVSINNNPALATISSSSSLPISPAVSVAANLPAGTTISAVSVKQERDDEAEIQELAAKLLEQQKAAMAKQAAQQQQQQLNAAAGRLPAGQGIPPSAGGQANILNYLTRKPTNQPGNTGSITAATTNSTTFNGQISANIGNNKSILNSNTTNNVADDKKVGDEESQKGHFGWATFGKIHIPYITRQSEKYCAVRMVEMKLLNKYLSYLHPDIYSSCTCVRSYYITEAEGKLLNEINHKHCDGQFGREMFTSKDLVVRLSDANKFYQFLDICYRKLLTGSKSSSEKCGFIRINKESVVPYTVRNGEQVVPLFYFEGETDNLRQKADYLSGWDLAYLKFCCKVQGIRNELFSSESVAVISLTDIKGYFPNGTEFEDYWPSKVVDSNLLIATKNPNNSNVHWTRQPTQPPPKVLNSVPGGGAAVVASGVQKTVQQQQVRKQTAVPYQTNVQNSNTTAQRMNASNIVASQSGIAAAAAVQALNGWSLPQAQGLGSILAHSQQELFRAAAQAQQQNQRVYPPNRNQMPNMMTNPSRQQYNYSNGISMTSMNCQQSQQPPPLVRSQSQNQCHMLNYNNSGLPLQSSSQQLLQPQQTNLLQRSISCDPKISTNINQSLSSSSSSSYPKNYHEYNRNNSHINSQPQQQQHSHNNLTKYYSPNNNYMSHHSSSTSHNTNNSSSNRITNFIGSDAILSPPINSPDLQIQQQFQQNSLIFPCTANSSNSSISSNNNILSNTPIVGCNNLNSMPTPSPPVDLISQLITNPSMSSYVSSALLSPVSPLSHIPSFNSPPSTPLNPPLPSQQSPIRQKSVICSTTNNASGSCSSTSSNQNLVRAAAALSSTLFYSTKEQPVIDLSSPQRSAVNTANAVAAANAALQQQQQQQQHQQQRIAAAAAQNALANGRSQANNVSSAAVAAMHLQRHQQAVAMDHQNNQRLCVIPEIPPGSIHVPPYKVQKVYVFDNVMVPCINMKAYSDSDPLMTLTDFKDYVFPNVPLDHCKRLIEALNFEMYKANRRQIQTLIENGKSHSENIPLIKVRDVIKYMPQLKYMMRGQEQPPNKRVRVS